jgi:hypothetical protein
MAPNPALGGRYARWFSRLSTTLASGWSRQIAGCGRIGWAYLLAGRQIDWYDTKNVADSFLERPTRYTSHHPWSHRKTRHLRRPPRSQAGAVRSAVAVRRKGCDPKVPMSLHDSLAKSSCEPSGAQPITISPGLDPRRMVTPSTPWVSVQSQHLDVAVYRCRSRTPPEIEHET